MQIKIKPSELKPGMKLVYGLVHQNIKLFDAGTVLNEAAIQKIKQLGDEHHTITVESQTPPPKSGLVVTNENGKINSKATFTNIVMDIRTRVKKK